MILLELELRPSSLANSLCLLLVLRFLLAVVLLVALLFAPVLVALLCFVVYVVFSLFCFFSVRRFVLAVFMLAQKTRDLETGGKS